jgi:signal transduction histidine kinase
LPVTMLLKIRNRWGYFIAFVLLLISYFLIFFIIQKLAKQGESISQSYDVINTLESIKAEITDAETGVRGYALTKDVRFLKPYSTGSKKVFELLNNLKGLTAGYEPYKSKRDSLSAMINKRLADLRDFIQIFQRSGFVITDEIISSRMAGKLVMDNIRSLVQELKDEEQVRMNRRNQILRGFFRSTTIIAVASLLIALVTIFYSLITYNRQSKAKEEADKSARAYSLELEDRVNELKKVNTELEELRSMEKFAATGRIARTIAHEVRNPLTNISLAGEQLKELTNHGQEADQLLDMISRNVNRINQLVSDLLSSTKFEQLEFISANVNDLVDEALELARDRIELNRIKVVKDYQENQCGIWVDKEKIKLSFLNIIVNAIEAMEKDKGVLTIRTIKQGSKCIVEFSDNGHGIDEDTVQKLFDPYFTSKSNGNGLGLTNAQNIILNHKGNINVHSKVGKGSSFIVTLNINDSFKVIV